MTSSAQVASYDSHKPKNSWGPDHLSYKPCLSLAFNIYLSVHWIPMLDMFPQGLETWKKYFVWNPQILAKTLLSYNNFPYAHQHISVLIPQYVHRTFIVIIRVHCKYILTYIFPLSSPLKLIWQQRSCLPHCDTNILGTYMPKEKPRIGCIPYMHRWKRTRF